MDWAWFRSFFPLLNLPSTKQSAITPMPEEPIDATFDLTLRIHHVPGTGYEFVTRSRLGNDAFDFNGMHGNMQKAREVHAKISKIIVRHKTDGL